MGLRKISEPITTLEQGVDLDTITTTGVYHQNYNVNTSLDLNYPVTSAGLLEVHTPENGAMIYQRYTAFKSGNAFYRGRYMGKWYPWRKILTD
ncbi:pyocin knob domain-containing protein [Corynebacterium coyleae]|uniref:pyocin knob domain-containing protein n=1 Tax=Corynebacterium coyleae TaxID=53374 RepID=UPI00254CA452|nr:pyocin knob domain-containing protein [Corynebacterium coyleae]MDK8241736.1 pyocin knob domain-containing protein [Corynebacterium coyleae]